MEPQVDQQELTLPEGWKWHQDPGTRVHTLQNKWGGIYCWVRGGLGSVYKLKLLHDAEARSEHMTLREAQQAGLTAVLGADVEAYLCPE